MRCDQAANRVVRQLDSNKFRPGSCSLQRTLVPMNKIYLLVPLTSVVVFAVVYVPHRRSYDERIAAQIQKEREDRDEKTKQQRAAQLAAQSAAMAALERRAREKAEREQREEAQREERANAEQHRAEVLARENRLRTELERICKDLETERTTVALIERKNKALFDEQEVLAAFVQQAEANRKAFLELIEKPKAAAAARP
jgi:hypothetical protein